MAQREENLYVQYAEQVYRYLFSLCREADTAEDLTQETFCQALKNLRTYRGDSTPQVWLCGIAKRLWYKELERRSRTTDTADLSQTPAPDNPAQEVEERSQRMALYQAMQKLDAETREVLYLRLSGEFSFREIGEILGKSEVWARVRFYRGKERLVTVLGGNSV